MRTTSLSYFWSCWGWIFSVSRLSMMLVAGFYRCLLLFSMLWCNGKYVAFVPSSWYRTPKILGISWVIGIDFVIHNNPFSKIYEITNQVTLGGSLDSFRMDPGCQKDQPWLESWNFQPYPQSLGFSPTLKLWVSALLSTWGIKLWGE